MLNSVIFKFLVAKMSCKHLIPLAGTKNNSAKFAVAHCRAKMPLIMKLPSQPDYSMMILKFVLNCILWLSPKQVGLRLQIHYLNMKRFLTIGERWFMVDAISLKSIAIHKHDASRTISTKAILSLTRNIRHNLIKISTKRFYQRPAAISNDK